MKDKIDKHYVSDIDKFLAEFDASHPLSESQKNEVKKYQQLFELRDNPAANEKTIEDIWKD